MSLQTNTLKIEKKEEFEQETFINKKNTVISPQMYNNFMNFTPNLAMNQPNFANFSENFNQNHHILNALNMRTAMNFTNNIHQNQYCMNNSMFFPITKEIKIEDIYKNYFQKNEAFQKQNFYYKI